MLSWLVSTSLRLRVVVLALSVLLLVVGLRTVQRVPLDVFPEFAPPYVEIQTEAPGLSTEEVESLITVPLENALNGVTNLKVLRSKSVLGLSSVVLFFEEGTDLMKARQAVQERLTSEVPRLPALARPPTMLAPLSSMSRVLKVGLSSQKLSQRDLTTLALWTIRPKLMSVQGVANVSIWGQRDRQLQVLVHPDRLQSNNVTLDAVTKAAGDAVVLEAGGFIDTPQQRLSIRHLSIVQTPEDLARTPVVWRDGVPLRLGDVADVVEGSPPAIGDAVINDGPGLLLIVEKQPSANTLEVTRKLDAALAALKPGLPDVEVDPAIFRPATFIERAVANLAKALLFGGVLVAVILIAFLFDWRTALISLTALPLSLLAAALVFHAFGVSLNTMILAGLVIALGEVVDDAIIDVENIVRRLRLNAALPTPESALAVVLKASLEVRSAVVYASAIVILVFVPIFFLEGVAGALFRPLGLAYVLAVLASLLVALTVTPALSLLLLPSAPGRRTDSPLTAWLKRPYRAVLPGLIQRPRWALALLALFFAWSVVAAARLGQSFLPDFQETDFLMHWVTKPGTSLEEMQRITARASHELRSVEGVRNFGSHIGRAELGDEVVGPNFTELWISISPDVDYRQTVSKIQEVVDGYPGLSRDLLTYLKERMKEVLAGSSGSIVVRLFGPDMDVLRSKAREVEQVMAGVQGVTDLKIETQVQVAQVTVRLRPDDAAKFGLRAANLRKATATLWNGTKVGEIYEDQKKFDVMVWSVPSLRTDVSALRAVPIEVPTGGMVPLGDVADVEITAAPNEIKRESASRRLDVSCNVKERDLGTVAREIEAAVRKLKFDTGYRPEFLGEYAARQESSRRLYFLAGLSLLGIALLLHVDFQSWRLTLLVLATLPFALIGGIAACLLTGGQVSLGTLVGFVTVLGIAARNGIMLVSHYRHLEQEEGEPFGIGLVLRGAEERLAPILMTALATGLALLPLVIAGNKPGQEIEYPLAVVILGGLVTSTLLNLFLLPPLYLAFARPTPTTGFRRESP